MICCFFCKTSFNPRDKTKKFCSLKCHYDNQRKKNDEKYIGKTFGKAKILSIISRSKGHIVFECLCECGNVRSVHQSDLKDGRGCKKCSSGKDRTIYNYLIGTKVGKWKVLAKTTQDKHGNTRFLCRCECGNTSKVRGNMLKRERSLACIPCGNSTHRLTGSPTYKSWRAMIARCLNPKTLQYKNWGGHGIKICDRWLKFENFLEDMGEKPKGNRIAIDRIDVNGDYTPTNCRWVTPKVNNNNRQSKSKEVALVKIGNLWVHPNEMEKYL
jgi:hypothetical protein